MEGGMEGAREGRKRRTQGGRDGWRETEHNS